MKIYRLCQLLGCFCFFWTVRCFYFHFTTFFA